MNVKCMIFVQSYVHENNCYTFIDLYFKNAILKLEFYFMFKSSIIFIDGKLKSYFDIIFMANKEIMITIQYI